MRRGATSRSTRSAPIRSSGEIFDYFGGVDDLEARRVRFIGDPLTAHRRGSSADPALLPLPCPLRRRASPTRPALAACAARANDLMALSRERIADELLKLLALAGSGRRRVRADDRARNIHAGPARDRRAPDRLAALVEARARGRHRAGRRAPARRPAAGATARSPPSVAARLRLSKRLAKRLVSAADKRDRRRRRRSPTRSAPTRRSTASCSQGRIGHRPRGARQAGSGRGFRSAAAT